MRAMVFAAGLGTRLKPYTDHHPKALVPVGGVPMLERVILKLKAVGVDEIVINVHHFAQQIIDFLEQNSNFGCTIHISDETCKLLDTGGGLREAWRWFLDSDDGDPIVLYNADILSDFDLADMIRYHRRTNNMATLLVDHRVTSRYLLMDDDMRMRGWTNVKTGEIRSGSPYPEDLDKYAFGGVHVIWPKIYSWLIPYRESGVPFSIMDFYIDVCTSQHIFGYVPPKSYHWIDIGKLDTLAQADALIKKDKKD